MKRITRRIGKSIDFIGGKGYANLPHKEGVRLLFEKLAEYEDLEEQELLMKLPCKVGDIVYEANFNRNIVSSYKITSIVIMEDSRYYNWKLVSGIYSNLIGFNELEIGEVVFFTKEEAEEHCCN